MKRREFIAGLLVTAMPGRALAQQTRKVWRIGFLGDGQRNERLKISLEPFLDGLRELGYVIGQDVLIEERWTEAKSDRLEALVAEFVRLDVDVIVTYGLPAAKAAQSATQKIPIVVAAAPDLVGSGLAAGLARPGGNITGLTDQVADFAEKEIQVL
jgi:putative ABC transport system substrate-binding protein